MGGGTCGTSIELRNVPVIAFGVRVRRRSRGTAKRYLLDNNLVVGMQVAILLSFDDDSLCTLMILPVCIADDLSCSPWTSASASSTSQHLQRQIKKSGIQCTHVRVFEISRRGMKYVVMELDEW